MKRAVRTGCAIAAAVLLGAEICIGMFAHGWLRGSFGDVLVVMLLWAVFRAVSPEKPRYGLLLPAGILLFAYGVELLQLWGFCDRLGIQNHLLRILIGTGFSVSDLICYTVGILPCAAAERILRNKTQTRAD